MRGNFELKPLSISPARHSLSPKMAGLLWWLMTIILLAVVISFSLAWLGANQQPDVTITCGTEGGVPCKP